MKFPLQGTQGNVLKTLAEHSELNGAGLLSVLETIPRGSIYTVLNRLEKDGWVSSRYQKVPGLQTRPLRFFKLTKMGKEIVRMDAQLATDVKTKGHLS